MQALGRLSRETFELGRRNRWTVGEDSDSTWILGDAILDDAASSRDCIIILREALEA